MNAPIALALALSSFGQHTAPPRVEVTAVATFADGSRKKMATVTAAGQTFYVHSTGSLCEPGAVSTSAPEPRVFGWKVTLWDTEISWMRIGGTAAVQGNKNGVQRIPTTVHAGATALDRFDNPVASNCKAVSWTLEAKRAGEEAKLVEAELWFVHKSPDGKETAQLQKLRLRENGSAEFYFDDFEVETRWLEQNIKLTIEVFGGIVIGDTGDGSVPLTLNLTRRYLTKQFLIGSWPKSGNTQLPNSIAVGEVVSFVLPPLQDDSGVFLGHRFSLRLRIKPLGEGN